MKPHVRRNLPKSMSQTCAFLFRIWFSIRHAQAQDSSTTNSALYILPPGVDTTSTTTSTFNYWWPFPPATISTPSSIGLTGSSSNSFVSPSSTSTAAFAFFPTVTISLNSSTFPHVNSSSYIISTLPSSSMSDSVIRITATSSSIPQAPSSPRPFKLVYLTPLFAILGLILGATFGGMLYGWHARRTSSRGVQDDFDELGILPHTSPSSRSGRFELEGYGHAFDKEAGAGYKVLHPGEAHNTSLQDRFRSAMSSPSDYGPTPLNDGIARPWYDLLPGLSAQASSYHPVTAPVTNDGGHLSPSWATVDLFSPSSIGNNDIAARDIRSHSSIRRAIAERLRVGSRRVRSRKEVPQKSSPDRGLLDADTDAVGDVAVRRASGNEYREIGGSRLQRRPQRGMSSTLESRYRRVVEEFESGTSPLISAPENNDHEGVKEGESSDDYKARQHSIFTQVSTSATRVMSGSSMITPKPSHNNSNTKLRPKLRKFSSPNDADNSMMSVVDSVKPGFLPSAGLTSTSPVVDCEERRVQERPTLRLLSPPPRVISPPAHPELFFADPVLGEYVENEAGLVRRDNNRSKWHSNGRDSDGEGGRYRRKLYHTSDGFDGTVAGDNEDGDGIKRGAESQRTSPSVSTVSAFHGRPMKPARTHEALGAVDAIMKTGWSAREEMKGTEQMEHRRKKMRQLSAAGLGNPPRDRAEREQGDVQVRRQGWREVGLDVRSATAGPPSGIVEERIRQLLERDDTPS